MDLVHSTQGTILSKMFTDQSLQVEIYMCMME